MTNLGSRVKRVEAAALTISVATAYEADSSVRDYLASLSDDELHILHEATEWLEDDPFRAVALGRLSADELIQHYRHTLTAHP